ncbi:MAG: PD-(D/E)XK nuclease family protein [Caldimonas sp.]
MATIARRHVDNASEAWTSDDVWDRIATQAKSWSDEQKLSLRDVVVIVPFVQLLPPARQAFARLRVWMPRIETTRTLAAALGPQELPALFAPNLDPALDQLAARQMLSRQAWAASWRRRDLRGLERAAARLVATTHELVAAASRVAPSQRGAWWLTARESIRVMAGPGGRERALAQIAVEWAALAATPPTDRLFELEPAAWIVVEAGGADSLTAALFSVARSPCLVIDTDAPLEAPFDTASRGVPPAIAVCASFEDEAEATAAQVLEHLRLEQRPVALIAQDRVLVRRVRALLERAGAALRDETGWKLSTTRAAARLMTLLVAAKRDASADQFFEWLKSGTRWPREAAAGTAALEAQCRKRAAWRIDAIAHLALDHPAAEAVRAEAFAALAPLRDSTARTLADWRASSVDALQRAGAMAALRRDGAGQQMIAVLRLDNDPASPGAPSAESLSLAEFTQWVDEALEAATFRADRAMTDGAGLDEVDVVITPLARAMLRPFAAAVLPGADDSRLGAFVAVDSLLSKPMRAALGLAGAEARRDAESLAFVQLLRLPRVTLLHRRADAGETLAASPLVERLALALAEHGATLRGWTDPRIDVVVAAKPTLRRAAIAPSLVPTRLSATSFEALRTCPYRFFARSMLALVEDLELDGDLEKRDYGNWLHQVLHLFHEQRRQAPADAAADQTALRLAGASTLATLGFDAAEFLPWSASFAAFVPRYVDWLRLREASGARWTKGEVEIRARPASLEGVELQGRIDRIDERRVGGDVVLELIDYKTGSAGGLKDKVRDPAEDTQLAFYAALVGIDDERPLKATYLALEARPRLEEIEHKKVQESADALIEGIAIDMSRLRGGMGLLPLGEGDACGYCEARGLCRRDHWSDEPLPPQESVGA